MAKLSNREDQFAALWEKFGPSIELARQHRFHPERRWRFDFAYVPAKVAIEIDGLTWFGAKQSGHQNARGIEGDMEKANAAIELGWRVLKYSQRDLDKRPVDVIEQIERVIFGASDIEGLTPQA